ncbi:hypothetical protein SKAU_G00224850 [Synaphobranchus kaupii]|uniref:Uncharacterized protein n=1 Tax=Synaphobranchus kaupii TaxID=118154 RepID=A0A9Q1IWE9_SYNKA|nr:hypothetical protein SKAU_G00224850 [Synaphobranchus kaupii]
MFVSLAGAVRLSENCFRLQRLASQVPAGSAFQLRPRPTSLVIQALNQHRSERQFVGFTLTGVYRGTGRSMELAGWSAPVVHAPSPLTHVGHVPPRSPQISQVITALIELA